MAVFRSNIPRARHPILAGAAGSVLCQSAKRHPLGVEKWPLAAFLQDFMFFLCFAFFVFYFVFFNLPLLDLRSRPHYCGPIFSFFPGDVFPERGGLRDKDALGRGRGRCHLTGVPESGH